MVTLYLVCDTSGSMAEGGKCMLMRGVARAVEQYIRLGYGAARLQLVSWNETAQLVDWNPDDEFPIEMMSCHGSNAVAPLCDLLERTPAGRVLLITDGFWSIAEARVLKRWRRGLDSDGLRIIKVGGDANQQLKGEGVFVPDDIFSVLDGWLGNAAEMLPADSEDEW